MVKKNFEAKIKLNIILIYLLVALVCSSILFYFYLSSKSFDIKRKTMDDYNNELIQLNGLIQTVNKAQSDANLFVVTQDRRYLTKFQEQINDINFYIDSIKKKRADLGVDTILSEITHLLKIKEQSIVLLNKQFTGNNPIDSLSYKLSSLSEIADSLNNKNGPLPVDSIYKNTFWDEMIHVFSSPKQFQSLNSNNMLPLWVDTNVIAKKDTLAVNEIIEQARVNYQNHISSIEKQINTVMLADQDISIRITELLTMLYRQIIYYRIKEINEDEELLHKSNMHALLFSGVALLLILLFILLIIQNVNKGYAARKALEKANNRTNQLMESRHQMLLSVSHDVKTPLNSILGYVAIYQKDGILTNDEATPIYNSGDHILALLNNLLEFSALEKGSVSLFNRNFSPAELCRELCEMFTPLAKKKSLTFDFNSNLNTNLILFSDSLKIKQILINILSNAIKYTTQKGVIFKANYTGNILKFNIIDTGIGISADKQDLLFKPFSRIMEDKLMEEGNGFGLYVVKGLVDLFDGKIIFKSEHGKGTDVIVELPVYQSKTETDELPKNILIIDDDEIYLNMLSRLCRDLGHSVTTCINKKQFLIEYKNISNYDFVLTDLEMNHFNGKEVLNQIRQQDKTIPVILITGRTDYSQDKIILEGFTDYLLKPVKLNDLRSLIGGKSETVENNALIDFFGTDNSLTTEIMEQFFIETVNNLILLKDANNENDIKKLKYLCHKMGPMFLQTNAPAEIIDILKQIEFYRHNENNDNKISEIVITLTNQIESFLQDIQAKYLSS